MQKRKTPGLGVQAIINALEDRPVDFTDDAAPDETPEQLAELDRVIDERTVYTIEGRDREFVLICWLFCGNKWELISEEEFETEDLARAARMRAVMGLSTHEGKWVN